MEVGNVKAANKENRMKIETRTYETKAVDVHLDNFDDEIVAQVTMFDNEQGVSVFMQDLNNDTCTEFALTTLECSALFLAIIKLGMLQEVLEPLETAYE